MGEAQRDEIAKLEALYAANPEGRVFTHLAEAYRKAGNLDRARQILDEGLGRHPDSATAYVVLGRVAFDSSEAGAAREAFARALALDEGNLVAHRYLGELALAEGDRGGALRHFGELLARDPGDEDLLARVRELSAPGDEATGGDAPALAIDEAPGDTAGSGAPDEWPGEPAEEAGEPGGEWGVPAGEPAGEEGWPEGEPLPTLDLEGMEAEGAPAGSSAEPWSWGEPPAEGAAPGEFGALEGLEGAWEEPGPLPESEGVEPLPAFDDTPLADLETSPSWAAEEPPALDFEGPAFELPELDADLEEEASLEEAVDGTLWPPADPAAAADEPYSGVSEQYTDAPEPYSDDSRPYPDDSAPAAGWEAEPEAEPDAGPGAEPAAEPGAESGTESGTEPAVEPAAEEAWRPFAVGDAAVSDALADAGVAEAGALLPATEGEWSPAAPLPARADDVMTETMAELYRAQGIPDRAAEVYRALLQRHPGDARLQSRLAEAEREAEATSAASEEAGSGWPGAADAAFTGGSSAGVGAGTPYAWGDVEEETTAGADAPRSAPIASYFRSLLQWRAPAAEVPAADPEPVAEVLPEAELVLDEPAGEEEFAGWTPDMLLDPAPSAEPPPAPERMPWEAPEPPSLAEPAPTEPEPVADAAAEPPSTPSSQPAAEAEGDAGEDEDLEMFRSWLQSLKR